VWDVMVTDITSAYYVKFSAREAGAAAEIAAKLRSTLNVATLLSSPSGGNTRSTERGHTLAVK